MRRADKIGFVVGFVIWGVAWLELAGLVRL